MKSLRHTLVSDGTTDANLIPIIDWSLKRIGGVDLSEGVLAETWRLSNRPVRLDERLAMAVKFYPCDILFIHRDAEKDSPAVRTHEICEAVNILGHQGIDLPAVAVVPVRMMEAWLCFDELAIRKAAGHPNGMSPLALPPLNRVESRPDPKGDLLQALRAASELSGRRLKKFNTRAAFWRIVDYIDDFSPLRELAAFQAFEESIRRLKQNEWKPGFYHG